MTARPYDWALAEPESSEVDTETVRGGTPQNRLRPDVSVNVPDGTGDNLRSGSASASANPLLEQALLLTEIAYPGSTGVLRKDGES